MKNNDLRESPVLFGAWKSATRLAATGAVVVLVALTGACTTGWGGAELRTGIQATELWDRDPQHHGGSTCPSNAEPRPGLAERGSTSNEAASFPGLVRGSDQDPPGAVRYIFHTHGMGWTNRCTFTNSLLDHLRERGYQQVESGPWAPAPIRASRMVRGEALDCTGDAAGAKPCLYRDFGEYRVDRFVGPAGDRVVVFTYYWHWDLWLVQGRFLNDDLGQNPGWLSAYLKHETMDKGLSDASTYLGEMGQPLREGMDSVICAMVRDAAGHVPTSTASSGLQGCLTSGEKQNLRGVRFGFLSHSLGSRMLFDVLGGQWTSTPAPPRLLPEEALDPVRLKAWTDATEADRMSRFAFAALQEQTTSFFMAANQLPLLGAGRVTVASTTESLTVDPCLSLTPFLASICQAPALTGESLRVIGFHDPGDLLGYRLSGGMVAGHYENLEFLTIEHRNAPQILWAGTWPPGAHDRELEDDTASALILCGGVEVGRRLLPRPCRKP